MKISRAASVAVILGLAATDVVSAQQRLYSSRADFARLADKELRDSSAWVALDTSDRAEAAMYDMFLVLHGSLARSFGSVRSTIRRADGGGTHAHPHEGILIDGLEVRHLIDTAGALLRAQGLPPTDVDMQVQYMLRFIVAHEYAHLLQYDRLDSAYVEAPANGRIIECAADIVGSALEQLSMTINSIQPAETEAAYATLKDFGFLIGFDNWLDGTAHPPRNARYECIARGRSAFVLQTIRTSHPNVTSDSIERVRGSLISRDDRDYFDGTIDITEWAIRYARGILRRTHAISEVSLDTSVVRDSSIAEYVKRVSALAEPGKLGRLKLSGKEAVFPTGAVVMRRSLPSPWECEYSVEMAFENAVCILTVRTTEAAARAQYSRILAAVNAGLRGSTWGKHRRPLVADRIEAAGFSADHGKSDGAGLIVELAAIQEDEATLPRYDIVLHIFRAK